MLFKYVVSYVIKWYNVFDGDVMYFKYVGFYEIVYRYLRSLRYLELEMVFSLIFKKFFLLESRIKNVIVCI